MNRLLNTVYLFFFTLSVLSAQGVGIGTITPDASAILDLTSTTKGVLFPRMTAAQRLAIATPATGLQVYQTDGTKGYYYFDGNSWLLMTGGGANGWSMTGNAGINPATNFIGTTDIQPFIAKANNEQVFRFTPNSNTTVIGYQANHSDYTGGTYNHVIGYKAGYNNIGSFGHFDGLQAGYNNSGNSNQFIGYNAGFSNTSGNNNLFIGSAAGYTNSTGSQNNILGYQAGYSITIGSSNHFIGYQAGHKNTYAGNNHFSGFQAGFNNTIGSYNFFEGYSAGRSNVTGSNNHFSGYAAGYNNTVDNNQFVGHKAGYYNTTGNFNKFDGLLSGFSNTTGFKNHFNGYQTGYLTTTGSWNHFNGFQAGYSNTTGSGNHFDGMQAGFYNTTGGNNHFSGIQAGHHNTTGDYNIAIGNQAGFNHSTDDYNIFIGWQAGYNNVSGHNNIIIGRQAGFDELGSNRLYIAGGFNDEPLIWGDFYNQILKIHGAAKVKNTSYTDDVCLELNEVSNTFSTLRFKKDNIPNGSWDISAYIHPTFQNDARLRFYANTFEQMHLSGNGELWIAGELYESSDSTLKTSIRPIQNVLSNIGKINAVSYNWKDTTSRSNKNQIGLLAQEVEQVYPELVNTDENGKKSVSYTHMVPVLLAAIKEQQLEIDELKSRQAEIEEMKVKMDLMEEMLNELSKGKE